MTTRHLHKSLSLSYQKLNDIFTLGSTFSPLFNNFKQKYLRTFTTDYNELKGHSMQMIYLFLKKGLTDQVTTKFEQKYFVVCMLYMLQTTTQKYLTLKAPVTSDCYRQVTTIHRWPLWTGNCYRQVITIKQVTLTGVNWHVREKRKFW